MPKPAGLIAIEREMSHQCADALQTYSQNAARAAEIALSLRRTGKAALLGMGASHAVNRAVEALYHDRGIDAVARPASEQLTYTAPLSDKTVLLVSQSGESAEIVRWLRKAWADDVFGMTLDPGSTLARKVPCLIGAGGVETAFAATRSLTVTIAQHLAILAALGQEPEPALRMLKESPTPNLDAALLRLAEVKTLVTSGRRLQGVAEAAALGFCELSRVPAFSLESGQLRHGPLEIMGPDIGVLLFRSDEPGASLIAGMAESLRDAEVKVLVFDTSGHDESIADVITIRLPRSQGPAAIFAILPAIQRLMLGFAAARVADVGTPLRSTKITRSE